MHRVRKLLNEMKPDARVTVRYVLLSPDNGSQHQWRMPVGWDKSTEIHDHRGDGFSIRIPVLGNHCTSCLSTPNFATELNHDWI